MIPNSEITERSEYEVKSKIGNIFVNEKLFFGFENLKTYFYENYRRKKNKMMKMGVNIYYLELMFILLNISLSQKLMKKVILTETLFLRRKDKKHQEKNLVVNLLELKRVKKAMMQTMKLVEYKHLSVSLKTDN